MSLNTRAAPNLINQEQIARLLQRLKQEDPHVFEAISQLTAFSTPHTFYAHVILPGTQTVANDVLDHAIILELPIDPLNRWKITSVTLQQAVIACKVVPSTQDYVMDILITRNFRQTYQSIFRTGSRKGLIRIGDYETKLDGTEFCTDLFPDDEFRIDVLQADSTVSKCWAMIKGTLNFDRERPTQNTLPVFSPTTRA